MSSNLDFSNYSEDVLMILKNRGKTSVIQEEAERELIKRFPFEKILVYLAEYGKTDDIAQAAFNSLKNPSEETLGYLKDYGKTDTIRKSAEVLQENLIKEKYGEIKHLINQN